MKKPFVAPYMKRPFVAPVLRDEVSLTRMTLGLVSEEFTD